MTPRCLPGSMRWQGACLGSRLYWGISSPGALALRGAKGDHTPMAILSDKWIRAQAQNAGMIEPFVEAQRREGCISYGLSSYGYDARVADEFKIFTNVDSAVVDPKDRKSTRLNSSH